MDDLSEGGRAWACDAPDCRHAMCAGCCVDYWCSESVRDTVCINRAHRVPWSVVVGRTSTADQKRVVDAMALRVFEEQKAQFPQVASNMVLEDQIGDVRYEIDEIDKQIARLKRKRSRVTDKMYGLSRSMKRHAPSNDNSCFPCPVEDCQGVVTQSGACVACTKVSCLKCGKLADQESHVCNEDDVASREEIIRVCTTCPGCASPIQKISGCDHMFCVVCKTNYSHRTGKPNRHSFGNPHYDAFVRSLSDDERQRIMTGLNNPGVGCGGQYRNYTLWQMTFKRVSALRNVLNGINTLLNHLIGRRQQPDNIDVFLGKTNRTYLRNQIDEAEYRRKIGGRLIISMVNREMNVLVASFVDTMQSILESIPRTTSESLRWRYATAAYNVSINAETVRLIFQTYKAFYLDAEHVIKLSRSARANPFSIKRFFRSTALSDACCTWLKKQLESEGAEIEDEALPEKLISSIFTMREVRQHVSEVEAERNAENTSGEPGAVPVEDDPWL